GRLRLRAGAVRRRAARRARRKSAGGGAGATRGAARERPADGVQDRPMKLPLELRARLEAVPYSALAVPLRLGLAWIFWSSAQVKLIDWRQTIELFADEYRLPLLPPELAASIVLAI